MSEEARPPVPEPESPRRVTPRILTEPRRPARIRALHAAPWLAVATVCVGAFMGRLDASIVATALPVIRTNLHASMASVEWVVLVSVLALAGAGAAGRQKTALHLRLRHLRRRLRRVRGRAVARAPRARPVRAGDRRGHAPGELLRTHPRRSVPLAARHGAGSSGRRAGGGPERRPGTRRCAHRA